MGAILPEEMLHHRICMEKQGVRRFWKQAGFGLNIELNIVQDSGILLQESSVSAKQIGQIVATLKESTMIDERSRKATDINACLDDALVQACDKIKKTISITKKFTNIPLYECHPLLLNQAFAQIFINGKEVFDPTP